MTTALAYSDARGRGYFDAHREPLADGGILRAPLAGELIPAPPATVLAQLPSRAPFVAGKKVAVRRTALAALLPAGYTRLLLPAYRSGPEAPALGLFGYTFVCAVDGALHVAALRTDRSEDWKPRTFASGELERIIEARRATDRQNRVLDQLELCSREYGCFTAQNVFLMRGEAALPVSPKCNARCVACISELEPEAGIPSPQVRIGYEATPDELARIALFHLARVRDGIVSFGQGCEGEPLLRTTTIARTIERIRASTSRGTLNLNTNGSLPASLRSLIDAGLDAVRISLNSFRTQPYAAYYRPSGYGLDEVLESARSAAQAGLRVSLNYLTHPGVSDERLEIEAAESFLSGVRVEMIQTRALNIDPERYFALVGRPREPLGMRTALQRLAATGARLGNFTHRRAIAPLRARAVEPVTPD
jgi:pyruvate-formate lyase-activating enzyme